MVKKSLLLTVLMTVITLSASGQVNQDSVDQTEINPRSLLDILEPVSLIRLIANPEAFNGKTIQVIGYLHLEFEGNAIYLHEQDYKHGLTQNGFWVEFSSRLTKKRDVNKFNNKYVIVIGTFKADEKGHASIFGGTLDNIVRLDLWNFERE